MAVELGPTWCIRHGRLRPARRLKAAAAEQQCQIGMLVVRGGRHNHEPRYDAVLV